MAEPREFIAALEALVARVKAQGFGPDEVMKILAEQGSGGEAELRAIVEALFRKL